MDRLVSCSNVMSYSQIVVVSFFAIIAVFIALNWFAKIVAEKKANIIESKIQKSVDATLEAMANDKVKEVGASPQVIVAYAKTLLGV